MSNNKAMITLNKLVENISEDSSTFQGKDVQNAVGELHRDLLTILGPDSNPDVYDPEFVTANNIEDIKLEAENEYRQRLKSVLEGYFDLGLMDEDNES